ncbi:hypothetical protein FC37_GL001764 [Lactobacillus gallinarum DSM 10532 = JCM 2011]|uniref:Uncharacterized protein n=1 Tax=Lactobacillus gallinarum DSM 10532 = JCM 2011 TaxID=1423748 RepID=A0A0R1NTE7_9LACO|nr:hypothetical protein FC37_GL001764 [Lactobacillus gallinarum DSM 10532 = JCM 2011]
MLEMFQTALTKNAKKKKHHMMLFLWVGCSFRTIGLAGFEPAHDGTKNHCLTTWL